MKVFRPYRFPPLAQFATDGSGAPADGADLWQAALADGFEQGRRDGYQAGNERGREDGLAAGHADGLQRGRAQARAEAAAGFEQLAAPVDAILGHLQELRSDVRSAQRKEVVELVAKVARQVIRAELALQPAQMLTLVDETLAAMPPTREDIDVYLNPEELKRIVELDPKRAQRWHLMADARLAAGECRIRAGDEEVDAGCHQRLAAVMEQVDAQLLAAADAADAAEQAGA